MATKVIDQMFSMIQKYQFFRDWLHTEYNNLMDDGDLFMNALVRHAENNDIAQFRSILMDGDTGSSLRTLPPT